MTDRIVELDARCPVCAAHVGVGERHSALCTYVLDVVKQDAVDSAFNAIVGNTLAGMAQSAAAGQGCAGLQNAFGKTVKAGLANTYQRPRMDYSRVRPSLGNHCPRRGCGLMMASHDQDEFKVWICSAGHYEAKERVA